MIGFKHRPHSLRSVRIGWRLKSKAPSATAPRGLWATPPLSPTLPACPVELHVEEIELTISAAEIVAAQVFVEFDIERAEARRRLGRLHRAADVVRRVAGGPGMLAIVGRV